MLRCRFLRHQMARGILATSIGQVEILNKQAVTRKKKSQKLESPTEFTLEDYRRHCISKSACHFIENTIGKTPSYLDTGARLVGCILLRSWEPRIEVQRISTHPLDPRATLRKATGTKSALPTRQRRWVSMARTTITIN